jgi:nucleotide-binding universal stress UspA family protein
MKVQHFYGDHAMFTHILVPLDGSPLAERALPHAEHFARVFGAKITLLQVLEPASHAENPITVDPVNWQIRKAEADLYLKGIAERILGNLNEDLQDGESEPPVQVDVAVREGKTAENIIDFAHNEGIDLLVISTHGSGGLSRWTISSVIQKVIHLIYLPVLIVRAHHSDSIDEMRLPYRRILVPIDSSRRSECSISAAVSLATGNRTTDNSDVKLYLTAINKPPEIPILEPFVDEIGQLTEQLARLSHEALSRYLNEMNDRLPVKSETCIVESADVTAAIHQMAEQEDIDLVILCAHGYTGQFTLPYGNVARSYIEHGTRSVLVIQDIHRSQTRPNAVEIAAEKSGRRS